MTKVLVGALLGITVAASFTTAAQAQNGIQNRIAASLDSKMAQPECKLDGAGDFRVSSAKVYLKTGIEGTGDASNRINALKNGVRVLNEAIVSNGQAKNPGAWYYLGRIYIQQGDLAGADSAFIKVETLAPGCTADVAKYRYRVWAALVNAGQTFRQAKQDDSAMVMLRAANSIHHTLPLAYVVLGELFNDQQKADSALVYFGKAAATEPTEPAQVKARNQAAFNYGALLMNAGRAPEAVAAFHRYLKLEPNDAQAKSALAKAFRAAGMPDSAKGLEGEVLASAGAAGTGTVGGEVTEADLFDIAVKQFNDKDFKAAAETFNKITTRNPNSRDALYNQASAYYQLKDGANLQQTAAKLIAVEPLSADALTLRAQGFQMTKDQDGMIKAFTALQSLPVDVKVDSLRVNQGGATFYAVATGREPKDEAGKAIPVKPLTLVVEFLGAGGTVVGTAEAALPPLAPAAVSPVAVKGTGAGITGWRYKLK